MLYSRGDFRCWPEISHICQPDCSFGRLALALPMYATADATATITDAYRRFKRILPLPHIRILHAIRRQATMWRRLAYFYVPLCSQCHTPRLIIVARILLVHLPRLAFLPSVRRRVTRYGAGPATTTIRKLLCLLIFR